MKRLKKEGISLIEVIACTMILTAMVSAMTTVMRASAKAVHTAQPNQSISTTFGSDVDVVPPQFKPL